MKRLAVCGWDEQSAALLRAISLRTDLRVVAIGDDRPAALVRARAATGLPCYQHVREMLRAVDYDAVLIGDTADRETLLEIASERGASILLRGAVADGRTLRAAISSVGSGSDSLNIARPELNHAGIDLLTSLTSGEADWAPDLVQIELSDASGVETAINTAASLVVRLQAEGATQVVVSVLRALTDIFTGASVQIRHGDRAISVITIQDRLDERWRISIQAPAGTAELVNRDGMSTLILEPVAGSAEQSELVDDDLLDLEAIRIANPASRRTDERFARHEASLLTAIEGSMNTGFVAPVHELTARGNLRLLAGGQLTSSPRAGHLRLLGN